MRRLRDAWEGKGEVPSQVRSFLDVWIPKLELDPFTAGSFEQWGKSGLGIFSVHLPREWRALFTVDQERRLVFLHTLQDHENLRQRSGAAPDQGPNEARPSHRNGIHHSPV